MAAQSDQLFVPKTKFHADTSPVTPGRLVQVLRTAAYGWVQPLMKSKFVHFQWRLSSGKQTFNDSDIQQNEGPQAARTGRMTLQT